MKPRVTTKTETFHGKDVIVRLGTETNPNLCATRGLTISLTSEILDTTTRCDAIHGYTTHKKSWKSWTGATDGLFVAFASAKPILLELFNSDAEAVFTVEFPDGSKFTGYVLVESFDVEAPHDGVIEFNSDLQGTGELIFEIGQAMGVTEQKEPELMGGLMKLTEEKEEGE